MEYTNAIGDLVRRQLAEQDAAATAAGELTAAEIDQGLEIDRARHDLHASISAAAAAVSAAQRYAKDLAHLFDEDTSAYVAEFLSSAARDLAAARALAPRATVGA